MANKSFTDLSPGEERYLELLNAGISPATGKPIPKTSSPESFLVNVPEQLYGLGDNIGRFDKGFRYGMSQEDVRGYTQSTAGKWFNGIVGRGLSIAPKFVGQVANFAGYAGIGLDTNNEFQTGLQAFMDRLDQETLKEAFPVHVSKEYREGSLGDKLGTASWWTTEVLDGLAYLGASAIGTKGAGALTKVVGDKAAKTAMVTALKQWGLNQNNVSKWTSTIFNTVMESSTESAHIRKDIYMDLIERGVPHDQAIKRAARAAHDTFNMNMATLWVSNRMEAEIFSPKTVAGRKALLMDNLVKGKLSKEGLQDAIKHSTKSDIIKPFLKGSAKASALEGMWEENIQNSVERYEKNFFLNNDNPEWGKTIEGVFHNAFSNVESFGRFIMPGFTGPYKGTEQEEGANAILIGSVIGFIPGGTSAIYERRALQKEKEEALSDYEALMGRVGIAASVMPDNYKHFYKTFNTKNAQGEDKQSYLNAQGQTEKDPNKVLNYMLRQVNDKKFLSEAIASSMASDPIHDSYNRNVALASYVWGMVSDPNIDNKYIPSLIDQTQPMTDETSKELGIETMASDNKDLLKKYFDIYNDVERKLSSIGSLSDDSASGAFRRLMLKTAFYNEVKRDTLQSLRSSVSETAAEQLQTLIQDTEGFLTKLYNNQDNYAQTYREQYEAYMKADLQSADASAEENFMGRYLKDEYMELEGMFATEELNKDHNYPTFEEYGAVEPRQYDSLEQRLDGRKLTIAESESLRVGRVSQVTNTLSEKMANGVDINGILEYAKSNVEYLSPEAKEKVATYVAMKKDALNEEAGALFASNEFLSELDPDVNMVNRLTKAIQAAKDAVDASDQYAESLRDQEFTDEDGNVIPVDEAMIMSSADAAGDEMLADTIGGGNTTLAREMLASDIPQQAERIKNEYDVASNLQGVASSPDSSYTPKTKAQLEKIYFDMKLAGAREKAALMDPGNENILKGYLDEKGAGQALRTARNVRYVFEKRQDITEALREQRLKELDELIAKLEELFKVASKNAGNIIEENRIKAYKYGRLYFNTLGIQLDDDNNFTMGPDSIAQDIRTAIGPQLFDDFMDEVSDLADSSENDISFSYGPFYALMAILQDKASPEQLESIKKRLNTIIMENRKYVSDPRTLPNYEANPSLGFDALLRVTASQRKVDFSAPTHPINTYKKEMDIVKLYEGLSNEGAEGAIKNDIVARALPVHAASAILNLLNSKESLLDVFTSMQSQVTKDYSPGLEQWMTSAEILATLSSESKLGAMLYGKAGTGKSKYVTKMAVKAYMDLKKLQPKQVYALAPTPTATKNINDAVFGQASGRENSNLQDLVNKVKSGEVKLVVLDEAYATSNAAITALLQVLKDASVDFLFSGDPRQFTPDMSSILNSYIDPATSKIRIVSPLSIGYRTNIQEIQNVSAAYEWTIEKPSPISAVSNVSMAAAASSQADLFGVMSAKSSQDIKQVLAARNLADGRTRVVIVENEVAKSRYADLPDSVSVKTYDVVEAQSAEYDEVYIDINPQGKLRGGQPLSDPTNYVKAMYVAYTRAKSFVMTTDPLVSTTTGEVNTELTFDTIIEGNRALLDDMISTTSGLMSKYTGKVQPVKKTTEVKEDKVDDQEDDFVSPDQPDEPGPTDPDSNDTSFQPDVAPAKIAKGPTTAKGTDLETIIDLVYPNSEFLGKFTFQEAEHRLTPDSDVRVFKVAHPYGKYRNDRVFVVAALVTNSEGLDVYAPLSYLSEEDLNNMRSEVRQYVLKRAEDSETSYVVPLKATDPSQTANTTSTSTLGLFSLRPQDAAQSMISGKLDSASRINLFLNPTQRLADKKAGQNTIIDTITSFVSRMFTQNRGRKPASKTLTSNNPKEVAKNMAAQIFTSRDKAKALEALRAGTEIPNKHLRGLSARQLEMIQPGFPYLLIDNVNDDYVKSSKTKFALPMVFSPLSRTWRHSGPKGEIGMHVIDQFHENITQLEELLKNSGNNTFQYGTSKVNKFIQKYAKTFYKAGGDFSASGSGDFTIVRRSNPPTFEVFLKEFNELMAEDHKERLKVNDGTKQDIQKVLNNLVPIMYGVQPSRKLYMTKAQFEDPTLLDEDTQEMLSLLTEMQGGTLEDVTFKEIRYSDAEKLKRGDDPTKYRGWLEAKAATTSKGKVDFTFEPVRVPFLSAEQSPLQQSLNLIAKANHFVNDSRLRIFKRFSASERSIVQAKGIFSHEKTMHVRDEVNAMRRFLNEKYEKATQEERDLIDKFFRVVEETQDVEGAIRSKSFSVIFKAAKEFGYEIRPGVPFTEDVANYLINSTTTEPLSSDMIGELVNFEGDFNKSKYATTNPINNTPIQSYIKQPVSLREFNFYGDFSARMEDGKFEDSWSFVNDHLMDPTDWAHPSTSPTHISIAMTISGVATKEAPIEPAITEQPDVSVNEVLSQFKGSDLAAAKVFLKMNPDATLEEVQDYIDTRGDVGSDFATSRFEDLTKALGRNITELEAQSIAAKLLPGVTIPSKGVLRFIAREKLNQMFGRDDLWGTVRDGIIYVAYEGSADNPIFYENVVRHEIFHYIFQNHLSTGERNKLFKQMGKAMGIDISKYSAWELEERMAEMFQYWRKGRITVKGKLLQFFQDLLAFFGVTLRHFTQLDNFFSRIEAGYYTMENQSGDLSYRHPADMRAPKDPMLGFTSANQYYMSTRFIRKAMRKLTETTSSTSFAVGQVNKRAKITRHRFSNAYYAARKELADIFDQGLQEQKADRVALLQSKVAAETDDAAQFSNVVVTPEEARDIIRHNLSTEVYNVSRMIDTLQAEIDIHEEAMEGKMSKEDRAHTTNLVRRLTANLENYKATLAAIETLNEHVNGEQGGAKYFDRVFDKIYPDVLRVKEVETLYEYEEDPDYINEDSDEGQFETDMERGLMSDEIEDNERVNQEARLTLQLKNWLSNMTYKKAGASDKTEDTPISSRVAFFRLLGVVSELDVNSPNMSEFSDKMSAIRMDLGAKKNTPLDAILSSVEQLFTRANTSRMQFTNQVDVNYLEDGKPTTRSASMLLPRNIKLVISASRRNEQNANRQYAILIDRDGAGDNIANTYLYEDIDRVNRDMVTVITAESVQGLFSRFSEHLRTTPEDSSQAIYSDARAAGPISTVVEQKIPLFNTLIKKAESQDIVRNLANTFASMKEMDLVIAYTEFDFGKPYIKVQSARSLGVQMSLASMIQNAIYENLHSQGLYARDIKEAVKKSPDWEFVQLVSGRLGLGPMFNRIPFSLRTELAIRLHEYIKELHDKVSPENAMSYIEVENEEEDGGLQEVSRIEVFFANESSTLKQISQILTKDMEWSANPSMKDSVGNTVYKYVTSYMLHDTVKQIIEGKTFPDYMSSEFFSKFNPFTLRAGNNRAINLTINRTIGRFLNPREPSINSPTASYFDRRLAIYVENEDGVLKVYSTPKNALDNLSDKIAKAKEAENELLSALYEQQMESVIEQAVYQTPALLMKGLKMQLGTPYDDYINRVLEEIRSEAVTSADQIDLSRPYTLPFYLDPTTSAEIASKTTAQKVSDTVILGRDIVYLPEQVTTEEIQKLSKILVDAQIAGRPINLISTQEVYMRVAEEQSSMKQDSTSLVSPMRVYDIRYYDAHKFSFGNLVRSYQTENRAEFLRREFTAGFLGGIQASRKFQPSFFAFSFIPAHRPRVPMMKVSLLSMVGIRDNVRAMIEQIKHSYSDPEGKRLFLGEKGFDPTKLINASILLKPDGTTFLDFTNPKATEEEITRAMEALMADARVVAEMIVEEGVRIPTNIKDIVTKLSKETGFDYLSKTAASFPKEFRDRDRQTKEYDVKVEKILPLVELWVANRAISSYFLNQLWLGDYAQFQGEADILKRMMGPTSPGNKPLVHPQFGMNRYARVALISDPIARFRATENERYTSVETFLKNQMGMSNEEFELLSKYYEAKGYKLADSQGFVTPDRVRQYMRGFGRSWGMGSLFKPVYYGPANYLADVNGIPTQRYFSFYLKFSSVELSDDLVRQFPTLGKLRASMEADNIDEAILTSAVKVGIPAASSANTFDVFEDHIDGPLPTFQGVVTIDNEYFRMQHNPASASFTDLSPFTQLLYFLKAFANDDVRNNNIYAIQAYSAVGYLVQSELEGIMDIFEQRKGESPADVSERVTTFLRSKLNIQGNERMADLLDAGVSLDHPAIAQKSLIQLMSSVVKNTIGLVKFPGGKYQLQAELGTNIRTTNGKMVNRPLMYEKKMVDRMLPDGTKTTEEISYAEIIAPKGFLPKDIEERVTRGEDVFSDVHGFAYRIPSTEIHSAIAIKIVGLYDDKGTNVIIAPHQLVAIMGHDFDADSMFTVSRQRLYDRPSDLFKAEELLMRAADSTGNAIIKQIFGQGYIGYTREGNNLTFNWQTPQLLKELEDNIKSGELYNADPSVAERLDTYFKRLQKTAAINVIVQSMIDTITASKNRLRMLTPIAMALVENDIKGMMTDLGVAPPPKFDMTRVPQTMAAYRSIFDGRRLTGVFANAMKVFAYIMDAGPNDVDVRINAAKQDYKETTKMLKGLAGTKGNDVLIKELTDKKLALDKHIKQLYKEKPSTQYSAARIKEEFRFAVNGKEKVQLQEFDDKGRSIFEILDMLVNVAIDNPKNQGLPVIGVNMMSANVTIALLMAGVPLEQVVVILRGPLFKEISRSKYGRRLGNALGSIKKRIKEVYKLDDPKGLPNFDIEWAKSVINNDMEDVFADRVSMEEAAKYLELVAAVEQVNHTGDTLFRLSRWFKIIKDLPVKDVDVLRFQQMMDKELKLLDEETIERLVNTLELGSDEHIGDFFARIKTYVESGNANALLSTDNSLSLEIPNIFIRTPHIAILTALVSKILNSYLPTLFTKFNKDLHHAITQSGFTKHLNLSGSFDDSSPDRKNALMDEFTKVLVAQSIYANPSWNQKIEDAKFYRKSQADVIVEETGAAAWVQNFIRRLSAMQTWNNQFEDYDPRRINMLDAINIGGYQIKYATLSAGSSLTYEDYKRFQEDLMKMRHLRTTPTNRTDSSGNTLYQATWVEDPSDDILEDMMIFTALSGATRFYSSSLVNLVPASIMGQNDKEYLQPIKEELISKEGLETILGPILVTVAANNVEKLAHLDKKFSSRRVVNETFIKPNELKDGNLTTTVGLYKKPGARNTKLKKEWSGFDIIEDMPVFYDLKIAGVPAILSTVVTSEDRPPKIVKHSEKAYVLVYHRDVVGEKGQITSDYYYKEVGVNRTKVPPKLTGEAYFFEDASKKSSPFLPADAVKTSHFSFVHPTIEVETPDPIKSGDNMVVKTRKDIRYILQDEMVSDTPFAIVSKYDVLKQDRKFYRIKGIEKTKEGSVLDGEGFFTYIVEEVRGLTEMTFESVDEFITKFYEEMIKGC